MSFPAWIANLDDEKFVKLHAIADENPCTSGESGGCSFNRYGVDMCPACTTTINRMAEVVGVSVSEMLTDSIENLPPEDVSYIFSNSMKGPTN